MGWERRGAGEFYYRTLRRGAKTERVYLGKGPEAELAAALDQQRRRQRDRERQDRGLMRLTWRGACEPLDALEAVIDLLVRAHLLAAGYRCRRGEWRRIR